MSWDEASVLAFHAHEIKSAISNFIRSAKDAPRVALAEIKEIEADLAKLIELKDKL